MSVKQAQREIDSAEFAEWLAYHGLEPFGEERDDLRAGIVASTIANVNRGKRAKAYKPEDFMPKFDSHSKQQTPDQMKAVLGAAAAAYQASQKRGD